MSARFELVRVDGGWFVRCIAANNRIVWITPGLYSRQSGAMNAIRVLGAIHYGAFDTENIPVVDERDPS